jgi:hypothetical protein
VGKICRGLGISEQTCYKWRHEYGGLKLDQADPEGSSHGKNTEPFPEAGVRHPRALAASRVGASRVRGRRPVAGDTAPNAEDA